MPMMVSPNMPFSNINTMSNIGFGNFCGDNFLVGNYDFEQYKKEEENNIGNILKKGFTDIYDIYKSTTSVKYPVNLQTYYYANFGSKSDSIKNDTTLYANINNQINKIDINKY